MSESQKTIQQPLEKQEKQQTQQQQVKEEEKVIIDKNVQNREQKPSFKKIILKYGDKIDLKLEIQQNDQLSEIKQYLSESTILYFYSNYHFVFNNNTLNEYEDLTSILKEKDEAEIEIELDPFDERSSKLHLKKIQEALQNPSILANILSVKSESDLKNGAQEEESHKQEQKETQQVPSQKSKEVPQQQQQTTQQPEPNKEKEKESSKVIDQEKKQVKNQKQQALDYKQQIKESLNPSFSSKLLQSAKRRQTAQSPLIQQITFSGYNPVPPYRKQQGDFYYLFIRTEELSNIHVTASPSGYFANQSNNDTFNPQMSQQHNQVFANLLDLLIEVSPKFKSQILHIMSNTQDYQATSTQTLISTLRYNNKFLVHNDQLLKHEWNMNKCEQSLSAQYGYDPFQTRDWNDEMQLCKALQKNDFHARLNRDKLMIKIYSDFVEAAVEGAKAVVEQNIQPLNPMEPQNQKVYIYNKIFFSYANENTDHFNQETGADALPTVSQANCDLRNLKLLFMLDIPGIHVLNTVLVDYKGYRIIAQGIVPGILNSEHNNCTIYGSIDDGKTIIVNTEFLADVKLICKHFYLEDDVTFKDEKGNEIKLAASTEIKGIKGSDNRKYILDLQRLSPRDLNYPDSSKYLGCVLRLELIQNFIVGKNYQLMAEGILKYQQKEKNDEVAEDKKKSQADIIQEILTEKKIKFECKLNPNISTLNPMVPGSNSQEQEKLLKEVSNYLIEKSIPGVIEDLIQNNETGRLSDCAAMEECCHIHGVNMRYLGKIFEKIDKVDCPHVALFVERVILTKSIKHLMRQAMRQAQPLHLVEAITHCLNILFCTEKLQDKLNNGQIKLEFEGANQGKEEQGKQKKKQNKQKKQKKGQDDEEQNHLEIEQKKIKIHIPECLNWKPKDAWNQICHIAQARYSHSLPANILDLKLMRMPFNRLSLLRDVCLSVGIHIVARDYNFMDQVQEESKKDEKKNSSNQQSQNKQETAKYSYNDLPFKTSDIYDIQPVVKHITIINEDARMNMELGKQYIAQQKMKEGLECYSSAIQILQNLYGPVHKDIGICQMKIASIYYLTKEFELAIKHQKFALSIFKKFYGVIHNQTAQAYSNFGYYYFCLKDYSKAIKYMLKSLYLFSIVGGEGHPDSYIAFMNLSTILAENQQNQTSLICLYEALDRSILVFGKDHLRIAAFYQAIAYSHYEQIDDIQKAIQYQEQSIAIMKPKLKENDVRMEEAYQNLTKYKSILEEKKKQQQPTKDEGITRQFGSSKVQQQQQPQYQLQQSQSEKDQLIQDIQDEIKDQQGEDREVLRQKLRQRVMQKNEKHSFKNNQMFDINNYLLSQAIQQALLKQTKDTDGENQQEKQENQDQEKPTQPEKPSEQKKE